MAPKTRSRNSTPGEADPSDNTAPIGTVESNGATTAINDAVTNNTGSTTNDATSATAPPRAAGQTAFTSPDPLGERHGDGHLTLEAVSTAMGAIVDGVQMEVEFSRGGGKTRRWTGQAHTVPADGTKNLPTERGVVYRGVFKPLPDPRDPAIQYLSIRARCPSASSRGSSRANSIDTIDPAPVGPPTCEPQATDPLQPMKSHRAETTRPQGPPTVEVRNDPRSPSANAAAPGTLSPASERHKWAWKAFGPQAEAFLTLLRAPGSDQEFVRYLANPTTSLAGIACLLARLGALLTNRMLRDATVAIQEAASDAIRRGTTMTNVFTNVAEREALRELAAMYWVARSQYGSVPLRTYLVLASMNPGEALTIGEKDFLALRPDSTISEEATEAQACLPGNTGIQPGLLNGERFTNRRAWMAAITEERIALSAPPTLKARCTRCGQSGHTDKGCRRK